MSKVIAVQPQQIEQLKNCYNAAKTVAAPSNAEIINNVFGGSEVVQSQPTLITPVVTSEPIVNMESTPVNLNSENVNSTVTDQVFGPSQDAMPINTFAQPVGAQNMFDVVSAPVEPTTPVNLEPVQAPAQNIFDIGGAPVIPSVPVSDPVMNTQPVVSVPVVEQNGNDVYIEMINEMRNQVDNFSSQMHDRLDKIQEVLSNQSKVIDINSSPVVKNNNFDETMVIPRDVMDNAIAGLQDGRSLAA